MSTLRVEVMATRVTAFWAGALSNVFGRVYVVRDWCIDYPNFPCLPCESVAEIPLIGLFPEIVSMRIHRLWRLSAVAVILAGTAALAGGCGVQPGAMVKKSESDRNRPVMEPRKPTADAVRVGQRAGEEWTNGPGMVHCWCPAGKFTMGSPAGEPDRDADENQVNVTLTRGYWLGKYEVTQGEWAKVMGSNPSWFSKTGDGSDKVVEDTSRFPVEQVTYTDALEFCKNLTRREKNAGRLPSGWEYRLPTEAEWEYACRAGTTTATAFGDQLTSDKANVNGIFPYNGAAKGSFLGRTTTVGSYVKNAWGLHDMHGNVYEWCMDVYREDLPGGENPIVSINDDNPDRMHGNVYEWCMDGYREDLPSGET